MTISFSGLASGLDTSSWVESLVALKQAKVETLEEEKETVLLSQETLNNIKSFFSSFRSLIEKVTDAKFGVASMDLFTQNLATSSNLDVLTASATTEAEEATYNVLVDKLASETQAVSNYSYLTTIVQTTTATNDSKLTSLGVKAGNIGVTVNGVERGLTITENDTIATFIEKLQNIGVEASYNEETGVFSMNIDDGAINDIDGTGIVDALHLEGVNEGYTSDHLQTSQTDTVYSAATEATLLTELGVKAGVITIHANDRDYNVTITNSSTLGSFIADLENNNIEAELDATGVFTISDAEITNEGTTDILDALGLAVDIYGKTQSTGDLTHETVVTQTTTATSSTLLKDLGEGTAISNGQTVIVRDSNNEYTTITVGTTTTLGELLQEMSNAGLYAALNSDGTVEIAGGTITGGTFDAVDALGLEREPYTAMVTGDPLTETVEVHKLVDLQTRLVDDLKVTEGYLEVTDADGNLYYEKIYSGQTIADFMTDMGNLGIATSLDEETGILTITGGAFKTLTDADVQDLVNKGTIREPDSRYIKGTNLLECLYGSGTISTDHITVASTYSKTQALSHSVINTINASTTTSLGNLGLTNGTAVFDVRGEKRTINVNQTMTIEDLMDELEQVGIASSWDSEHSKIMIENSTLSGGTSNLSDVLNLTTEVSGKYVTSDALYSRETITIDATRDTVLADYGITNSMSTADRTVNLYNSDGTLADTMVVGEGTTIGNLLDWINGQGDISATLEDGYLTINNGYIENAALEASMGLETSNKSSYVLGSVMTVTTTAAVTGETTLGEIISTLGTQNEVQGGYNLNFNGHNLAVSADTTINELINLIYDNGGTAVLDHTGRLSINGGTLTGSVAEALGITSVTHTSSVSASGETLYTTKEEYADLDTTFADLGINNSSYVIYDNLGVAVKTINVAGTDTIGSFFDDLKANGIDGTISNGVISLESAAGKYITGALANALGLDTQTVTEVVNTSQSSTLSVTHTDTVLADITSTLGAIGAVTANGQNILIYDENQICIGTITGLTTSSTVGDMFDALKAWGINATITNGVISMYSESGRYAAGTIMDNLGITIENGLNTTITIAQTVTSSGNISYTKTVTATEDTLISDTITLPADKNLIVHDADGAALATIAVDETTTYGQLFDRLAVYGIDGDIHDGSVVFTPEDGQYVTGAIINSLGMNVTSTVVTTTVGMTNSSSSVITYTDNVFATEDSLITDFVSILPPAPDGTTYDWVRIYDNSYSSILGEVTVYDGMTFGELFRELAEYGIDGDIHDGVISFTTQKDGIFVMSDIIQQLGIQVITSTVTKTVGMEMTSTASVTYTDVAYITEDTLISDIAPDYKFVTTVSRMTEEEAIANGFTCIYTAQELIDKINNDLSGQYILMNDIDMSEVGPIDPIGDQSDPFTGILHGNGHTISNLTFNDIGITNYGLFGCTEGATIGHIRLENASIAIGYGASGGGGKTGAGLLVGQAVVTMIGNCSVEGSIIGGAISTGLLVGYSARSSIEDCSAEGSITGAVFVNTFAGGLVGSCLQSSVLKNSHAIVDIDFSLVTTGRIGGLFGEGNGSNIFNNYAYGEIKFAAGVEAYALGHSSADYTNTYNRYDSSSTLPAGFTGAVAVDNLEGEGKGLVIRNSRGEMIAEIDIASDDTVGDILNKLSLYGIRGSIENGVITLDSTIGYYATGTLLDALGFENITTTVTVGMTSTSTAMVTYTSTAIATGSTTMEDLGVETGSYLDTISAPEVGRLTQAQAEAQGYTCVYDAASLQTALEANEDVILMSDIDLSGINWTPIEYSGRFNGNGYIINNLNVNSYVTIDVDGTSSTSMGFFAATSGATLTNLRFNNANISTTFNVQYMGILAGVLDNTTVQNVTVDGDVTHRWLGKAKGALAGYAFASTISNAYTNVNANKILSLGSSRLAGFIHTIEDTEILNSSAAGSVSGSGSGIAGFVYDATNSTITNCSTEVDINKANRNSMSTSGIFIYDATDSVLTNNYYDTYLNQKANVLSPQDFAGVSAADIAGNHSAMAVISEEGEIIGEIAIDQTTTLNDIISRLNGFGINATLNNGVLSLDSVNGNFIRGYVAEQLGITTVQSGTKTVTAGATATSTAPVGYTETVTATSTTLIRELNGIVINGTIDYTGVTGGPVIGISSASELRYLANEVNSGNHFEGYTFVLTEDIDLSGYSYWTSIGNSKENYFAGTFDGAGQTISGMKQDIYSTTEVGGLFGVIAGNGTIKNLNLESATISISSTATTDQLIGGVVGIVNSGNINHTALQSVTVSGLTINSSNGSRDYTMVGGIVGQLDNATMYMCRSYDIAITNAVLNLAGGVVGRIRNGGNISNSGAYNIQTSGDISTVAGLSGAVGWWSGGNSTSNITNCYVASSSITTSRSNGVVGGLVGMAHCSNSSNKRLNIDKSYVAIDTISSSYRVGYLIGHAWSASGCSGNRIQIREETCGYGYEAPLDSANATNNVGSSDWTIDDLSTWTENMSDIIAFADSYDWQVSMQFYERNSSSGTFLDILPDDKYHFITRAAGTYDTYYVNSLKGNQTMGDFVSILNMDYSAYFSSGRLNVTVNNGDVFMGTFVDGIGLWGTSSNQYQSVQLYEENYMYATNDTTLSELGAKSGVTFTIYIDGTSNTVSFAADTTINEMRNSLLSYGIDMSYNTARGEFTISESENYIYGGTALNYFKIQNGSTYQREVSKLYKNTDSSNLVSERAGTLNASSTLGEIGAADENVITVKSNGNTYSITLRADSTISEMLTTLAGFGIAGSISNDRLTLIGSDNAYISNMSSELVAALKLRVGEGCTYTTEIQLSDDVISSDTLYGTVLATMTTDTTWGEISSAAASTIRLVSGGKEYTVDVELDDTIDDILTTLAGFGISGSVDQGRLTLVGTDRAYITFIGADLVDELHISYGNGETFTTSTQTTAANTTSDELSYDEVSTLNTSTTFGQLGMPDGEEWVIHVSAPVPDIIITSDMTIDDMLTALAGAGIAGQVNGGKLTLSGNKEFYIESMPQELIDMFDMTFQGFEVINKTISENATSANLRYDDVRTMSTATTLGELGITTDQYITVVSNGTQHIVTVNSEMTVDDIISTLAGYGISGTVIDGRLNFTGGIGTYIKDMSQTLKDTLKLTLGNGNSWTTEVGQTWVNSDSDEQTEVKDDVLITGDTILSSINGYNNGDGRLVVHQTNGQFVTITVDGSSTVDEFFEQISQYGLVGTIGKDGKVTITGIGNVYLQAASGGSNILTSLKLSNVVTNVQTITSNRTSDTLTHIVTVAASGTTTLDNLEDTAGNGITFNGSGNVSLVLETTSDAGNQKVTLNFSRTQSLYDVIDALAQYGIQASIDAAGRFSVSSSNLTDFDISGELGDFLMGNYTKEYGEDTTYNVSTNLVETTVVYMNDASKLADFGITGGNILITQQGVNYTINIDPTSIITIGDFRNLLAEYGFNSIIDSSGRLSVSGIGESYLSTIAGGSNILDRLGLTDWTLGEVTQSSDHLTDTETVVNTISMSDRIADLTDAAGNNLGITAGQIYVYQDGTRSTVNIDTNDTLETLAAKLSQYGITVGISQEGRLYFDGNNDSYLTTNGLSSANASNILSKLNIEGNWSTRYDSTSGKLQYEEEVVDVVSGSTKLSDLKDASGNDLNITEGTYYVYSNGVRNTETITADTTVNDFMATLAKYGLIADIAEDGSISVGAYNNTYLATSALAGQNSNVVSTLFAEWDFVNIYTSNGLDIPTDEIRAINRDTKLADINEGTYQAGYITVVKDGVQTNIELKADDTVGTLMDELALYGFESVINEDGQLIIKNSGDSLLQNYTGSGQASNALTLLGIGVNDWISTNTYKSDTLNVVQTSTLDASATRDTLLSELGVSTGEYYVYNNGVKYTALISSDETLGSFMDTLKSFGLETSLVQGPDGAVLSIVGKGNSYIAKSASTTNASNVVDVLFTNGVEETNEYSGLQQTSTLVTTFSDATLDTKLSYYDTPWGTGMLTAEGDLSVTVNGVESVIKITADETFGSLIEKFNALGLEATLANGELMIQSGYDTFTINTAGTTSSILSTIGLTYHNDLGGYVASDDTVLSTTTSIEEKTLSVSNYADMNTKLGTLNISDGSLTVYRNGERATIQIDSDDTFSTLRSRLAAAFSDLELSFEDGYLKIYSTDPDADVQVGSTTDKGNFAAITGITNDGSGSVKSARELYCVNGDSVITTSGIFRNGDVTEGTFIVGNATFTIDDKTTLSGLIAQINASDEANATAFWDNIDGKLVIKSRTTGSAFVNIEAGTSNFTDIMGYTTSEWAADGSLDVTRMNIDTQEVGENARVQINGTTYTSTSNTITSDVSRIKGLTINLKGLTEGTAVTLTVERDKETLANAISDVVDSYNELMKNVDEAIATEGALHGETTLKLIRNQLRNMMTSSDAGTTIFRNLDSIGISVSDASASNISTTNEAIINLAFDKDKFLDAFEADQDAVKELLIGGANNTGIFTKVETLLESALQSVTGYFSSADDAYRREINRLDDKIAKANEDVERYRARLEAKFSAMDMLIAQMQQQYSTFLTT